ncbi:hypothetical protein CH293_20260 [Rhodococcus sp. 14-2470-1b]|nr:hypothetical protein CH293_20260 [Rhodococcus sp. 14-2470-1b]
MKDNAIDLPAKLAGTDLTPSEPNEMEWFFEHGDSVPYPGNTPRTEPVDPDHVAPLVHTLLNRAGWTSLTGHQTRLLALTLALAVSVPGDERFGCTTLWEGFKVERPGPTFYLSDDLRGVAQRKTAFEADQHQRTRCTTVSVDRVTEFDFPADTALIVIDTVEPLPDFKLSVLEATRRRTGAAILVTTPLDRAEIKLKLRATGGLKLGLLVEHSEHSPDDEQGVVPLLVHLVSLDPTDSRPTPVLHQQTLSDLLPSKRAD